MTAATVWSAGASLSLNTIVASTTGANGMFFRVTQAGTTGSSEPEWSKEIGTVISEYGGKEFSQFKNDLGELASSKLSPISVEMNKLMKDEKYLDSVIIKGKERAINVADPVINKIYEIIGFFRG